MSQYNEPIPAGRDPQRWQAARKRVAFKRHLLTYLVVNAFLWLIWAFTGAERYGAGLPWPVWPTLGWGIGLAFNYIGVYHNDEQSAVEREYEKLKS